MMNLQQDKYELLNVYSIELEKELGASEDLIATKTPEDLVTVVHLDSNEKTIITFYDILLSNPKLNKIQS
ncbi:hypothetical protein ACJMK2_034830 [Sinanodonta woodiana]|uniref:Uncharacterized protein n=1 Tax=Sinanodonta woodiana TaxID=1069815 RepID=A0ABD3WWY4_SINWO